MSEADVLFQLNECYPELGEAAGYILWNWTSFPFWDGHGPMTWWLNQIEEFLRDRPDLQEVDRLQRDNKEQ